MKWIITFALWSDWHLWPNFGNSKQTGVVLSPDTPAQFSLCHLQKGNVKNKQKKKNSVLTGYVFLDGSVYGL